MNNQCRIRNRKHLNWLKTLPCMDCFCLGCDPAHVPEKMWGSMALKTGDNNAVPLCRFHHAEQHRIGHKRFWGDKRERVTRLANDLYAITGQNEPAIRILIGFSK